MQTTLKKISSLTVCIILLWSSALYAQGRLSALSKQRAAVGAKFGTLGFGVEVVQSLKENMNVRLGGNYYSGDYDGKDSELDYEIDVNLRSWSLLADWFPYEGEFRVSGGVLYNGNNVEILGKPKGDVTIGNVDYPAAAIGNLTYKATLRKFAPYLGIGVGNAVGMGRKWSFALDLGIVFQGSPDIELSASGPLASDRNFQKDLRDEQADLEEDLEHIKYYPVLSFGFTYRFR